MVGHWPDADVGRVAPWMRAGRRGDVQRREERRFGDNMREVAVTEGDKVEAKAQFGWSVYYGIGDLVEYVKSVPEAT